MRYDSATWATARSFVTDWLTAVAEDHHAPDMWSEVSKSNAISGASELTAEYQKPFSAAELQQLEKALPEIERYIATTQPLNDADKEQVHKRFAYLLDAAKQGARKIDWLNIFVAQIIALVTAGLVDPKVYSAVMSHAATVLNAIFTLASS